jgi:deoxyribose-phosphate aldolase
MAAGADFIKTSTGKVVPAATMPVTLVMLEAIRDFERATGRQVGMKPAGRHPDREGSRPVPRDPL